MQLEQKSNLDGIDQRKTSGTTTTLLSSRQSGNQQSALTCSCGGGRVEEGPHEALLAGLKHRNGLVVDAVARVGWAGRRGAGGGPWARGVRRHEGSHPPP